MSEWLKIKAAEFNKPRREKIHGADVELFVSPYDIPEAVRGFYKEKDRKLVVEFKYIGGAEPLETVEHDPQISLRVGRYSERIYQIEIEPDEKKLSKGFSVKVVLPQLRKTLEGLAKKATSTRRLENYTVAKKILSDRADELRVAI